MENIDYTKYEPFLGDERYVSLKHKYVLDFLRVKYYRVYGKDPSITFLYKDTIMFRDDTLPITGSCYYIRGSFPFKIYFQSCYKDGIPSNKYTVTIKTLKEYLNDVNLDFISSVIKNVTGEEINLVVGDCRDKEYSFSFIDLNKFKKNKYFNKSSYITFFELLCDNNTRNILYIGRDLKDGFTPDEINAVNIEYVDKHFKDVLQYAHISEDELRKSNEYIRSRINK